MTEKMLYYDMQSQNPPKRHKKRRRAGRALFMIIVLILFATALFSVVYRLEDEISTVSPYSAEISVDRPDVPEALLELLQKNPETYDFVMGYSADRVPLSEIDISGDVAEGEIPLFLQWDKRWGYDTYGSGMIAVTGCGPTCLSMVAAGLTGDLTLNPRAVADFSAENGYYAWGSGTEWTLMSKGAERLGLKVRELPLQESTIISELRSGKPVICSVGSGDFTTDGHYIVLTGVNKDGTISIHDPNSIIRSGESWDLGDIIGQIKNLWSFTVNDSGSERPSKRPPAM